MMSGELTATGAAAGSASAPGIGTVIGAGIGAAGDLIGGLIGSSISKGESRNNRREARRQFNAQMDFNRNFTQYRVQDAIKAGINPLAAIGSSTNVSPTISAGGESNAGYYRGSAVSSAINKIASIFTRQEKESRDLDLEAKRIRNDQMRSELDIIRQPGLSTDNSQVQPMGSDSQLFRVVYDLNGDPRLMVNQDVTENDADNAGYKSSMLTALANGFINPLSGHIKSRQYRMMLDDMHYRATGRHISNLERLYVSPTELAIVGVDSVRGSH